MHELQTVYGTEDLENLMEILLTDTFNRAMVAKRQREQAQQT